MATNKELYEAFIYNLNCYDAKIIDKDDFINAMEEYIYENQQNTTNRI